MNYRSPKEIAVEFEAAGIHKSHLPVTKFILIAVLGGAFIAFGGLLSVIDPDFLISYFIF